MQTAAGIYLAHHSRGLSGALVQHHSQDYHGRALSTETWHGTGTQGGWRPHCGLLHATSHRPCTSGQPAVQWVEKEPLPPTPHWWHQREWQDPLVGVTQQPLLKGQGSQGAHFVQSVSSCQWPSFLPSVLSRPSAVSMVVCGSHLWEGSSPVRWASYCSHCCSNRRKRQGAMGAGSLAARSPGRG